MSRRLSVVVLVVLIAGLAAQSASAAGVAAPRLVRSIATGETGWFASPSLVDLNGDRRLEIVAPTYSTSIIAGWTFGRIRNWLETSGMPMHTKIREAVERVGAERVLYGSDVPFHHPKVEIEKVRVSGLTPELVDRVLGENARALFLGEHAGGAGAEPAREEVGRKGGTD